MLQMDLARLEVLFFFVTVQEFGILRQIHAFLPPFLFLMQVAPQADHLQIHVCELDMPIFAPIEQKLHVSSVEQIAHAIWADTQDSLSPTQHVPLWNVRLEKSTSQKLDM